jgi:hypothetical protein
MTAERAAGIVARWVRLYTRDLPPAVAQRRIGEIDADLHDHIAHERARGTDEGRIALSIVGRMVRGLPADASWRRTSLARTSTPKEVKMSKTVRRSVLRVAAVTALILLVPLLAMIFSEEANWSVADFVFAAVLLVGTGLLLELAARRPHSLALRAIAAAIGVAAIVFGEAEDAPGLVLFGCLLIAGTVVMVVRTALRSE